MPVPVPLPVPVPETHGSRFEPQRCFYLLDVDLTAKIAKIAKVFKASIRLPFA